MARTPFARRWLGAIRQGLGLVRSTGSGDTCNDAPPPIDAERWQEVPVVFGRVATEEDVRRGCAVFVLRDEDEEARLYTDVPLPALAELANDDGSRETVVLIQTERLPRSDDILIGYRMFTGADGVARLGDARLL